MQIVNADFNYYVQLSTISTIIRYIFLFIHGKYIQKGKVKTMSK